MLREGYLSKGVTVRVTRDSFMLREGYLSKGDTVRVTSVRSFV